MTPARSTSSVATDPSVMYKPRRLDALGSAAGAEYAGGGGGGGDCKISGVSYAARVGGDWYIGGGSYASGGGAIANAGFGTGGGVLASRVCVSTVAPAGAPRFF